MTDPRVSRPTKDPGSTSIRVKHAIEGDRESVAWIVAHFQPFVEAQVTLRLGGNGKIEDVEDIVSELWTVVLQRLKDLIPREGRYAPVLVSFLGTTALQTANNFLRKKIRRGDAVPAGTNPTPRNSSSKSQIDLDGLPGDASSVVTNVHLADVLSSIRGCLEKIAPDQRDVLVLRIMEQRTNQEIAEILNIEANTVAQRYHRALKELRANLPETIFAELLEAAR